MKWFASLYYYAAATFMSYRGYVFICTVLTKNLGEAIFVNDISLKLYENSESTSPNFIETNHWEKITDLIETGDFPLDLLKFLNRIQYSTRSKTNIAKVDIEVSLLRRIYNKRNHSDEPYGENILY